MTMMASAPIPETAIKGRNINVFLCHSSGDKPAVEALYERLIHDGGIDPWLDKKNLLPGQDWRYEIAKAVRASDVVLVCLSLGSISKEGFVNTEIKYALDKADTMPEGRIFIIPCKIEPCQLPERLSSWQWVNLYEDDGYDRLLLSLRARSTSQSAQRSSPVEATTANSDATPELASRLSRRTLILAGAPAVAGIVGSAWYFSHRKEPQFSEPAPTPDPTFFRVQHESSTEFYDTLDRYRDKLKPLPFPRSRGGVEPVLHLAKVWGSRGPSVEKAIEKAGRISFHAVGSTGSNSSPNDQCLVADRMTSDFREQNGLPTPSFFLHLGDVIYDFGESQYYYDQFYAPYRDYPAPILAVAGNHDGIVAPGNSTPSLYSYLQNFCAEDFNKTPDAKDLNRTTQIQPGPYFTFEAPFIRVLVLYSNVLNSGGVISNGFGQYPELDHDQHQVQLEFLEAALTRVRQDKFDGAVIIALHHDPYLFDHDPVASPLVLFDLDAVSKRTGVWPHAVLSGNSHNYQRFTRTLNGMKIPYIVAGAGGHGVAQIPYARGKHVPLNLPIKDGNLVLESYADFGYSYLQIVADPRQLRIVFRSVLSKIPEDWVTVDLASHQVIT